MGGGRIFLKIICASLFNEDLSNEPNFDRIDLARQYLTFNLVNFWKKNYFFPALTKLTFEKN